MSKKIVISLIIIILVIVGFVIYQYLPRDISSMSDDKLISYTLKQKVVKTLAGTEPIVYSQVDSLRTINQESVDIMKKVAPQCASEIVVGRNVRSVSMSTATRQIGVLWSPETKKVICYSWQNISK